MQPVDEVEKLFRKYLKESARVYKNRYGIVAVLSARILNELHDKNPIATWDFVACKIFGEETTSRVKGCPRGAFLGLCEEGLIKGVPAGNYTRSRLNKKYAVDAVNVLKSNPNVEFSAQTLWRNVAPCKTHNDQMHVVLALWKNGLINDP